MTYYVYIVECSDGSLYTGVTNNLDQRIYEHKMGLTRGYTYTRRPVKLVFWEGFNWIQDAIAVEKQIKGWRKDKKHALITRDFELLRRLSVTARDQMAKEKLKKLKVEDCDPSTSSG